MHGVYPNIQFLLRDLARQHSDQQFLKVPANEGQVLSYKISSFYRRALRSCGVFKGQLRLDEGEKVAVLTRNPHDMAFILHGLWLARMVAVPLDVELPDQHLVKFMNACGVKAVVFPLEASARIAAMFSKVRSVEHWIVAGSSTTAKAAPGIKKFEDLFAASMGDEDEVDFKESDVPALIVCGQQSGGEPKKLSYSQASLLAAARAIAGIYPANPDESDLSWCLVSKKFLNGLLHSYIVPLFTGIPALLIEEVNLREFWTALKANGATLVIFDQVQLRFINRRGRPRTWLAPPKLRIILCTYNALSSELLITFERRFKIPVQSSYSVSDGGSMVTTLPLDLSTPEYERLMTTFPVPSSGVALDGHNFIVKGDGAKELPEGERGEVAVHTPFGSTKPVPENNGVLQVSGFVSTGDEGFFIIDSSGRRHLYVLGRKREAILREGLKVFPGGVENFLLELNGVEFALMVGFPNSYVGHETGLYLVTIAGWDVAEKDVYGLLRKRFSWPETPKVLIHNNRPGSPRPRSRQELLPLFEEYYGMSFAEGRYIIKEYTERTLPVPGAR